MDKKTSKGLGKAISIEELEAWLREKLEIPAGEKVSVCYDDEAEGLWKDIYNVGYHPKEKTIFFF